MRSLPLTARLLATYTAIANGSWSWSSERSHLPLRARYGKSPGRCAGHVASLRPMPRGWLVYVWYLVKVYVWYLVKERS
jgi:hypothetical protein